MRVTVRGGGMIGMMIAGGAAVAVSAAAQTASDTDRTVERVVVRRIAPDGQVTTTASTTAGATGMSQAEIDAIVKDATARAPAVAHENCPHVAPGDERETVLHREKEGKTIIVVCTNRVERLAANASAAAERGGKTRRDGLASGLAAIETARTSILADRNLSDAERQHALDGLAEGEKEMRAELAKAD